MNQEKRHNVPEQPTFWPLVRGLLVGLGLLVLCWYILSRGGGDVRDLAAPSSMVDVGVDESSHRVVCGPSPEDGRPVSVDMLYSDDKRAWIDEAADRFSKLCPNLQIRTTSRGDLESADAILAGGVTPTLWSPADDLVLRYLDHRWKQRGGKAPFDIGRQTSIARSPMVVLIWEDRRQVAGAILSHRPEGEGSWIDALCAGVPRQPRSLENVALGDKVPSTWIDWYNSVLSPRPPKNVPPAPWKASEAKPASADRAYVPPFPTLDEMRSWGRVKLVHTSPTRSAAGLEVLYLMAYEHLLPPNERPAALREEIRAAVSQERQEGVVVRSELAAAAFARAFAERRGALGRWFERCEAGLDPAPKSPELLTEAMFNVGPSRYDAVMTYEHLVFPIFARIDDHADFMATMRVIYPQPTLLNEHPVVLFDGVSSLTEAQRGAAERWIAFLRSREMQELAVVHGFRPAVPEVSIREFDAEENPFLHFRRYGVDIGTPLVEPPRLSGEVVNDLLRIWEDATGKN